METYSSCGTTGAAGFSGAVWVESGLGGVFVFFPLGLLYFFFLNVMFIHVFFF